MLGYTKRFLPVDGKRVAHYRRGEGPAIVLLHGLPTSCFLWRNVIAALQRRYTLIAPDLLGLGDTSGPLEADHSLLGQATLVEGLMEQLEVEEAVVVGHDVGGAVAQWLALDRPRRVRGLVLVSTAAYDNWPVSVIRQFQRLARHPAVWRIAMRAGMTRRVGMAEQGFRRGVKFPGALSDQEIDEYLRPARLSRSSREHLRRMLLAMDPADTVRLARRLHEVEVPSRVVWGADDAFLSPLWGHRLTADLRGSSLHILPDCGHFVPEERAGELAGLIDLFCRKLASEEGDEASA